MKNVKSETALKFGVGIYRNNSEKKVYECGGKKKSLDFCGGAVAGR